LEFLRSLELGIWSFSSLEPGAWSFPKTPALAGNATAPYPIVVCSVNTSAFVTVRSKSLGYEVEQFATIPDLTTQNYRI
jgi:hypothetical protein